MAAPKRTTAQRERDLLTVAAMYCEGKTVRDIAAYLDVSHPQIVYDLKIIRRRWQEQAAELLDEHRASELAKLDHVEAEYWDAWHRSQQEWTEMQTEQGYGGRRRALAKRRTRDGNVLFLDGVLKCIDRRIRLLGLEDAPSKVDLVQHVKRLGLDDDMTAAVLAEAQAILRGDGKRWG